MKFEYIYESKTNTTTYYPNTQNDTYELLKLFEIKEIYVDKITTVRCLGRKDYKVIRLTNGDEIKYYKG